MTAGLRATPLSVVAASLYAVLAFAVAMAAPGGACASSPEVVDSAPAEGATAVPCNGRYWVQFENNVAAVEENASLVTLETAEGAQVPRKRYSVSLPDVELEFAYRRCIWVDVKGLERGRSYVICIAPGIMSKNGKVNDSQTRIAFTTVAKGEKANALAEPQEQARGPGGGEAGRTALGSASGSDAVGAGGPDAASAGVAYVDANGKQQPAAPNAHAGEPMPFGEAVLLGVCCLAVLAALVFAFRRSRANTGK